MKPLLKILHLEDLQSDADLVARVLLKAGMTNEVLHVTNKTAFIEALTQFKPDIVLSDHSLPTIDSHEALSIVKQMGIESPFILVTATVSEEYAVEIMKENAADYILKDRLQRLPNAIKSAIEKYNLQQSHKRATEVLRASEQKYKLLFEQNPLPMWTLSRETLGIIAVNEAAVKHYGYTREEFLQLNARYLYPAEDVEKFIVYQNRDFSQNTNAGTWRHKKKDGSLIMVDLIVHDILYDDTPARLILANDVTAKLAAEAELAAQQLRQQKMVTEISIQVQEREREDIGKELHDNITQILATSKLYIDHAIKKEGLQSSLLEKSRENILLAQAELRKLSHSLVAPALDGITLSEAIHHLLEALRLTESLQGEINEKEFDETKVDKNTRLMLYRIVQEQLNNVLKHAKAKNIIISLQTTGDDILLKVEDDGSGFDTTRSYEGIGLQNIRNRVGFYDGTTTITSAPGEGCILEVRVPLN
jgi:two-component system, NarL family, sensor histidine kinase UhpB